MQELEIRAFHTSEVSIIVRDLKKMALGKKCGLNEKKGGNEGLGLGFVTRTRSFGRKRVVISNDMYADYDSVRTPTKKHCVEDFDLDQEKSLLEALPQDILIRVLCGVDHDDLKRLFHVSKAIQEATLIAKKWHFAYSTPKKALPFRSPFDLEDASEFEEVEAPNAPKQLRVPRSRLSKKKLGDISVALFASQDGEGWPKRDLFMEMEAEI